MRLFKLLFLIVMALYFAACVGQPAEDAEDVAPTIDPTIEVDPAATLLEVDQTSIASGSNVQLTVRVFDTSGNPISSDLPISFSVDTGSSTFTFSSVTNNGDGTFSATATGVVSGSSSDLGFVVNGVTPTSTKPNVQVNPGPISTATSEVSLSNNLMLELGSVVANLQARDAAGNLITSGGETISFQLDSGSVLGSFGAVSDNGDGTYSSTFTSSSAGTGTSIQAQINGSLNSDAESITSYHGEYRRTLSLSAATNQTEYQVRVVLNTGNFNYAQAAANGEDMRFTDLSGNLLDHWTEVWDVTGDSIFWVQIPVSGTSQIYLYSGNALIADVSSAVNTFSYPTQETLYAEMNSRQTNLSTKIGSYMAGNSVTVETNSGPENQIIGMNLFEIFNNAVRGLISVTGPISGRIQNSSNAHDSIAPFSFKNTVMGYAKSRNSDSWEIYNPNASAANITIRNYNSSGVEVSTDVFSVNPGEFLKRDFDVSLFGLVESSIPVVGFYLGNTSDGMVMPPARNQLIGVNSNAGNIGCTVDGTSVSVYSSSGGAPVVSSCDKGDVVSIGPTGSQGSAPSYFIDSTQPVIAHSQADSDGSESAAFFPVDELNTEYLLPGDIQYIAVATLYDSTITVYEEDGNFFDSANVTSNGLNPAKAFFGNAANTVAITGGARVVSDKPFFVYYEYSNQDETNVLGMKQARKVSIPEPVVSVGSATDLL